MADKEFKSLKEYIIKNYKYYKLELEPLIFGQLKVANNKRNEFYPIEEIGIYPTKTKMDMHLLEPYLISIYKPNLNKEFLEDDEVTIFSCDITEKDFEMCGIYE